MEHVEAKANGLLAVDGDKLLDSLYNFGKHSGENGGLFGDNWSRMLAVRAELSARLRERDTSMKWGKDVITDKWLGISQGAGKALRAAMLAARETKEATWENLHYVGREPSADDYSE